MNQLFTLTGTTLDYPLPIIIFNILFAFILGAVIAIVYKKNHRGLSYSSSFVFTLVLLTTAGSILMMIVGNSLARAFSLFGAFSIIRFRTAVKEAKDIAYVFIALITGMAVGTNNYTIAVVSTGLIIAMIFWMTKRHFGEILESDLFLNLNFDSKKNTDVLVNKLKKLTDKHQLVSMNSFNQDKLLEISYQLKLKDKQSPDDLLKQIKKLPGVKSLRLVNLKE